VGEFHWEMNEVRYYEFGDACARAGPHGARAGRWRHEPWAHLFRPRHRAIDRWGGILKNIDEKLELYTRLHNAPKALYLRGAKHFCQGIIDYIAKHAERARGLAASESRSGRQSAL
jgi:hypothetical protein